MDEFTDLKREKLIKIFLREKTILNFQTHEPNEFQIQNWIDHPFEFGKLFDKETPSATCVYFSKNRGSVFLKFS